MPTSAAVSSARAPSASGTWERALRANAGRLASAGWIALVLVYPVTSYLSMAKVPLMWRLAWIALAALAAWKPGPSLLAFVAAAPLLPIVPALERWPMVSLLEQWLLALLVAAWVSRVRRHEASALPSIVTLFLVVISASLAVTLMPLAWGEGGVRAFALAAHSFLRNEYLTSAGARNLFAPVVSWAVIVEGIGFGWLLWRHLRSHGERGFRDIATAALAGGGAVAVWAVWQWWTRSNLLMQWTVFDPYITRVNASFTDVNTLGSYMAALIPLFAGMIAVTAGQARLAAVAGLGLAGAAAVFTGSRAAWLGFVLGTIVFVALAWRSGLWNVPSAHRARLQRLAVGAVLVAVLVTTLLSAYATLANVRHRDQRSYVDAVLYTLNLGMPLEERLKGRVELWRAGIAMVRAEPLGGIGLGRFYRDVSRYAPNPGNLVIDQENAHNYALQLAAECGLPALATWLGMLAFILLRGYRTLEGPASRSHGLLVAAAIGGTLAFLATCLTGHPLLLREGQFAFWLTFVLAAGLPSAWSPSRLGARWIYAALLAVACLTPIHGRSELRSIDWSRRTAGMHAEEADGTGNYRWTKAVATFYVPQGSRTLALQVRSLAPMTQQLAVSVDGQRVDTVDLVDHDWRQLDYMLPRVAADGRFHEVVLRTTPTWTPDNDPRELGVMLRGVEWRH